MPATAPLRLTLELDRAADPIAGTLHPEEREAVPFCGWLALSRAIELALAAARPPGSEASLAQLPASTTITRNES